MGNPINKRNQVGNLTYDPSSTDMLSYSDISGGHKVAEIGRNLLPLGDGAGGYTTDASTAKILPGAGKSLAVYNTDTSVHSVTLSQSGSTAALAAGATNVGGNVGIACTPGQYTLIACYLNNWVITDSADLLVYLVNDSTYIIPVATAFDSTPPTNPI